MWWLRAHLRGLPSEVKNKTPWTDWGVDSALGPSTASCRIMRRAHALSIYLSLPNLSHLVISETPETLLSSGGCELSCPPQHWQPKHSKLAFQTQHFTTEFSVLLRTLISLTTQLALSLSLAHECGVSGFRCSQASLRLLSVQGCVGNTYVQATPLLLQAGISMYREETHVLISDTATRVLTR